ncbi:hypothetical protein I6G82_16680 [Lysinibacillus macroides]|uniref:hypothetical protein n=1 Tax=Lysinibacillus macroides TaxID=33935 RepID=UPI0006B58348|nr:hypothetical protein [Lysinibacillus macroides]QPR66904.1 hypothetical protein I6G82_16680 [Lysinibacillus macroides]
MKFSKYLASIVVSVLTFTLVVSPIAQVVKAEEIIKEQEEQEIQEFAEQLKFVWEEASIKDESGKIIGFDIEKMENTYGQSEDPEALEAIVNFNLENEKTSNENFNNSKDGLIVTYTAAVDRCVEKEIGNYFGSFLGPAAWTAVLQLMYKGDYTEAAKKLIKLGIKGNVFVIAGTLGHILVSCIYEEEGWTGKTNK